MRIFQQGLTRLATVSVTLGAGLLLAGCGGGDPYAGLWTGSMAGTRQVSTIVLDEGDYYMLYSRPNAPNSVGGLIQGNGEFDGGKFKSSNARNFNWEGAGTSIATVAGKIGGHQTVSGTVNGNTPFSVSFSKESDGEAKLAAVVGSFTGEVVFALGVRPATFTVTSTGAVSSNINGCPITGTLVPRLDANAYDLTLQFGGFPCVFPGAVFKGVTIYREGMQKVEAAVVHASRTQAIAFTGVRP